MALRSRHLLDQVFLMLFSILIQLFDICSNFFKFFIVYDNTILHDWNSLRIKIICFYACHSIFYHSLILSFIIYYLPFIFSLIIYINHFLFVFFILFYLSFHIFFSLLVARLTTTTR